MDRKDFLDSMIELRNKGKNITQTASPENSQKDSPKFSTFLSLGVTSLLSRDRSVSCTWCSSAICLTSWKTYPQHDISAKFTALLLLPDVQFVNAET